MMTCELILVATLFVPAQEPIKPPAVQEAPIKSARVDGGLPPINEQIEVMRALLVRRLGVAASGQPMAVFGGDNPFSPQLSNGAANTFATIYRPAPPAGEAAVEGVYLEGYGVVFTAMLPATGQDPRPGAAGSKESPGLSDWEKEQKRLRGEPVPEKTSAPRTPSVGDVILKMLAENGKHLTALKDDERMTIAVTFRGEFPRQPFYASPPLMGNFSGSYSAGSGVRDFHFPAPADGVRDQMLLAELHLKQGQSDQALDVLKKVETTAQNDPLVLAEVYPKLAQAYLGAGKLDEARAYLERAKALKEKPAEIANPAQPPPRTTSQVPARLTISAPKKLLDFVGSGKITMEEFRKQATVEYTPAK